MDGRGLEHAREQIIPEALDLHVFAADQSEIDEHVQADKQLNDAPGMSVLPDEQEDAQRNGQADVAEIEQIEQVVLCQPQGDRDRFEYHQHQGRHRIFLHPRIPSDPGLPRFPHGG